MNALHIHGGRTDLAAARYPDAPLPWLDLSTGINPCAWPTASVPTVDLHSLPSPAAIAELEAAAAVVFGTTADRVVALPGSELGLRMLAALDLPTPIRFVVPSYATHAEAIDGAVPIARHEIETVADGTLLTANPNNPDGHHDTPQHLLAIARNGVFLIVDEAFADVAAGPSIIPLLRPDDRAIVFRSFGKFFGLPGVRLGFMIGPPEHLADMRQRLGSWPISAHAVAYGIAAYRDAEWIAATRVSIVDRATRLDAMLARHGLKPRSACALFRLIETDAAPVLFERLARAGVLTRTFDYAPRWLRMGVPGNDQAFARLDEALGGG